MNVFIIFPHQLFENTKPLQKADRVMLIEEYLFFNQYNFHQQKIHFHKATMLYYADYLRSKKIEVQHITAIENTNEIAALITLFKSNGVQSVTCYNVVDDWLGKHLRSAVTQHHMDLNIVDTPMFMNTHKDIIDYFGEKKRYLQTDFYTQQRKRFNILITKEGKPEGDKWSFDTENRLKYPKEKLPPKVKKVTRNKYYTEATNYVSKNFKNNIGAISDAIIYPTTHTEAKEWLQDFLQNRFNEFGPYEDAIVDTEIILHHSLLTPMLNVGLLTPMQIVETTVAFAAKHNTALQNTEGFIRQIIGWREFIRGVYVVKGSKQRSTNYWNFTRKIPASFYSGTTGIMPFDDTIKKVLATGYCHHIERLMILGNFMLLCEFDPNEVYRWFMELFIDAYDWVMVTNVYGMSQFADGGMMATKPYISGSNYILKMSNYKKTNLPKGWDAIWDGLFWHFIDKQRSFFLSNPRLGMLVHSFDKMPEEKRNKHLDLAKQYLELL